MARPDFDPNNYDEDADPKGCDGPDITEGVYND